MQNEWSTGSKLITYLVSGYSDVYYMGGVVRLLPAASCFELLFCPCAPPSGVDCRAAAGSCHRLALLSGCLRLDFPLCPLGSECEAGAAGICLALAVLRGVGEDKGNLVVSYSLSTVASE